jgi:acetyl-CoA acetyltransferase
MESGGGISREATARNSTKSHKRAEYHAGLFEREVLLDEKSAKRRNGCLKKERSESVYSSSVSRISRDQEQEHQM